MPPEPKDTASATRRKFLGPLRRPMLHFQRTLGAGILVILPIGMTVLILKFFFDLLDPVLQPAVDLLPGPTITGAGLIALIVLVYLLGLFAALVVGRRLIDFGHRIMEVIPVVKGIYGTTRMAIQILSSSNNGSFNGGGNGDGKKGSDGRRQADIGLVLVEQLFSDGSWRPRTPLHINTVIDTVCNRLVVDRADLMGTGRHRRVVAARGLVAYLARSMTTLSYPEIAQALGRRHHSTFHTAVKRITKQLREQLRIDARGRSSASTGLRPAHQPAHRSPLRAQYASLLLLLQSINEAPGLAAAQLEPYQVQNSLGVGEEDFVDPRTSAHRYQQQERLAPLRIGRRDNAQLRPLRDRSNHTVPLAASALAHIDPSRLQAVEAAADQLPHLLVGNPLLEATQYRQRVASSVSQLLQDAIHFVRMELAQHVG